MGIDKLLRARASVEYLTRCPHEKTETFAVWLCGPVQLCWTETHLLPVFSFCRFVSLSGKPPLKAILHTWLCPMFQFRHCFIQCTPSSKRVCIIRTSKVRIHSCCPNFNKASTWGNIVLKSPLISRCFWARTPMQVSLYIAVTFFHVAESRNVGCGSSYRHYIRLGLGSWLWLCWLHWSQISTLQNFRCSECSVACAWDATVCAVDSHLLRCVSGGIACYSSSR